MWHRSQWSRCGADRWVMQSLSLVWDVCFRKIVFFLVKSCGVIIDQDLLAQAINSRPKGFVKNNHNRYNHNSLLFCQRLPQTVVSSIFFFFFDEFSWLAGLHRFNLQLASNFHFIEQFRSLVDGASLLSRSICSQVTDISFTLQD